MLQGYQAVRLFQHDHGSGNDSSRCPVPVQEQGWIGEAVQRR